MTKNPGLSLNAEEGDHLTKFAQSRTLPVGDVFKARLILALADGQSYRTIQNTLQTTAPTISRWKQRFEKQGLDGLEGRHKVQTTRLWTVSVFSTATMCLPSSPAKPNSPIAA